MNNYYNAASVDNLLGARLSVYGGQLYGGLTISGGNVFQLMDTGSNVVLQAYATGQNYYSKIASPYGGIIFGNTYGAEIALDGYWGSSGAVRIFQPTTDGVMHLGQSTNRWLAVWSNGGAIQTSDRNKKENIKDMDDEFVKKFIMSLKPSTYKFKDTEEHKSDRTHFGFISQDIEEITLPECDITAMDFAGFCKDKDYHIDENTNQRIDHDTWNYSLRYDEFIAPAIKMIQMQQNKIEELEKHIIELENKIIY